MAALAVVVSYLEQIPWLELQSLIVFAAGFLLGARYGALVGALAMGTYSAVNPYGFAHPLVFASQILGRAAVGVAGGIVGGIGLPRAALVRAAVLAGWAVLVSLWYDLVTNLAGGLVYGQMLPTLVLGVPFALGHVASNVVLFVGVGGPLLTALEPRRRLLVGGSAVLAAALLLSCFAPAAAQGAGTADSTTRDTTSVRSSAAIPDTMAMRDTTAADTSAAEPPEARGRVALAEGTALGLDRQAWLGRAPVGAGDAAQFVGAAPRFYDDFAALEPLSFAGAPPWISSGILEGMPMLPRGAPWEEPARAPDGGRAGCDWTPLFGVPTPAAAGDFGSIGPDSPAETGARGTWRSVSMPVTSRGTFSSVWAGAGDFDYSSQGFRLGLSGQRRHAQGGLAWSAWTKKADFLGELGRRGAHGLELSARGRLGALTAWLDHGSTRASLSDRDESQFERRGGDRSRARIEWAPGEGRAPFAGVVVTRLEDRVDAEGPIVATLGQVARELSGAAWLGRMWHGWRVGATGGWARQRLRQDRDGVHYGPGDLDVGWGGGFAEGRVAGGRARAEFLFESAAGRSRWLPRASWESEGDAAIGFFVGASGVSVPALSQVDAAEAPSARLPVERPHGWTGEAGIHVLRGGDETRALRAPGAPGLAIPGRLEARLGVLAWTLDDVTFPSFGFLAREILEGPFSVADVQGVAAFGLASWTPARWAELGLSAYGAGRTVPVSTDIAAPDARALLWAGPRVRLFSGSLDIAFRGELDLVGPRAAADEVLPALVRPGARIVVGLGNAWVVLRGSDLDDGRHPLPGRRFDGERLLSPGRVLRVYGEWRFSD